MLRVELVLGKLYQQQLVAFKSRYSNSFQQHLWKFTSGTVLGTTEAGAIEYDGTHLYFTATNAGTRYQLDQQQPLNSNLTTIAGLTATTNNFMVSAASAWSSITPAAVNLLLPVFTSTLNGLVPLSGGGTTNFLRADGTWAAAGGGPTYSRVSGSNFTTASGSATVDVTGLTFATAINSVYEFEAVLFVNAGTTAGIIYGVNHSTSGGSVKCQIYTSTNTVLQIGTQTVKTLNTVGGFLGMAYSPSFNTYTPVADDQVLIKGVFTTGANTGNFTVKVLAAGSQTITIYINSFLKVTKIGLMLSLNQIQNKLIAYLNSHAQINTVDTSGDNYKFAANRSLVFPACNIQWRESNVSGKFWLHTFQLILLDKTNPNTNGIDDEIDSDMLLIADDFLAWLDIQDGFTYSRVSQIIQLTDEYGDRLSGIKFRIVLSTMRRQNDCVTPKKPIPPPPPPPPVPSIVTFLFADAVFDNMNLSSDTPDVTVAGNILTAAIGVTVAHATASLPQTEGYSLSFENDMVIPDGVTVNSSANFMGLWLVDITVDTTITTTIDFINTTLETTTGTITAVTLNPPPSPSFQGALADAFSVDTVWNFSGKIDSITPFAAGLFFTAGTTSAGMIGIIHGNVTCWDNTSIDLVITTWYRNSNVLCKVDWTPNPLLAC